MYRKMFLSLAAVAALIVGMTSFSASAYDGPLLAVDDPIAMHDTFDLVGSLILQDTVDNAFELVAVDNTISALCRAENAGNTYQRPGGFCDQVATNKPLGSHSGGPSMCPAGTVHNPAPPPACIPEV